ncbi:MAG TPA: EamA family transporter RarD [Verrucomicrobiota bacterium]|nr:EamA family transporter RarD [Verrucomicrobiota bacterium]
MIEVEPTGKRRRSRTGLLYGIGAYGIWGVIPLYFHFVAEVPPWIVLCHRIIWSALFLGVVVSVRGEWKAVKPVLRSRRNLLFLTGGSALIALNWLIFIYAVGSHQVVESSLGYFINPLLSVALGVIFLRERLRGWQWVAVAIVGVAVANLALRGARFPWIAVSLACTFGFYGLARKTLDINSLHGLMVETAILVPAALVALAIVPTRIVPAATLSILSLSGIITAVPLLMFGAALRRLKLSTIGFLQYIGPTGQLLVAVLVFHEPLDRIKLASFALCWLGIAVYTADSALNRDQPPIADEPE